MDGRDLATTVGDGVLEGKSGDPLRSGPGDDLDALGGVRTHHVLDAGIQIFGVLADDDQIHVLVPRLETWNRPYRPKVGVQAESLAQGDIHGPEAHSNRRRDWSLDGDLVAQDRVEDGLRQRRPLLRHDRLAGLDDLPLKLDARGVEDTPRGLGQFGADSVSGDERHESGHGRILATWA